MSSLSIKVPAPVADCDAVSLRVRGLSKRFDQKSIFANVDFDVKPGQSVALIGANGTGKSTLLRCCARLIEPDQGQIDFLGQAFSGLKNRALRKQRSKIGFVFQRHQLVPRLSALSNVIHGALGSVAGPRYWLHGIAPEKAREAAYQCLNQVGLAHLALQRVSTLSGGQSQRVAIARSLMQQPEFIMADEPAASLDPKSGQEVMHLLTNLVKERNMATLFVSHHMHHALEYADHVIGLRDGQVIIDESTQGLTETQLKAAF